MTNTTELPTPREVIIEAMAMEVEAAHEKHVIAYSINRVKTYGWKLPAGSTGQESEPTSMATCIAASDAFDEILRKQLQDAFELGQAAGQAMAAQCPHQIQEPAPVLASPAAVAVPDDLAELTTWMLVEDLVQAECTKNRLHQEYMGKAMPEDVYQRFERLRDERVPALRAQVYARLAATPAAPPAAAPVEGLQWTGNADADAALVMLDRIDCTPEDDARIDEVAAIVRKLASTREADMGNPIAQQNQQVAAPVALPEPVAWRTRYRSEPGMIGHYPWTYTERRRGAERPEHEWEQLHTEQQLRTLLATGGQALAVKLLASDHSGMKVNYRGLFSQVQRVIKRTDPGYSEMLRQLEGHLQELGQRWYAGDTAVVDEILQLYCIESDARKTVAATASAAPQQADARDAESDYQRGYRHGYNRRDAEVPGALL